MASPPEMGAIQGKRTVLFVHRRMAVAHPEPTKAFLKLSPEMAMLSAPFRCTHPPPPVQPFLLKQNLPPKVIAGSDITR